MCMYNLPIYFSKLIYSRPAGLAVSELRASNGTVTEMPISSRNMCIESAAMKVVAEKRVGEGAAELVGIRLGAGSSNAL